MFFSFAAAAEQVSFIDKTAALGLKGPLNSGTVCWVDIDGNGWVDLIAGGRLWINEGGSKFTQSAYVGSVVAADLNNNGLVDLFSWSRLRLFRNFGDGNFYELELPAFPDGFRSSGACLGDFNGNGWVDIYVGGYEGFNAGITYPDIILINEEGRSFKIGRKIPGRRSRGVTACDFDHDGDLDIYVSCYRLQPNQLWINDGRGKFTDKAAGYNAEATSPGFRGGHSIGACWGDFNNSGYFDLFAGNFAHDDSRGTQPRSRFLRNTGIRNGFLFEDMGPCGIHYQESYASPAAGDFDNDGKLDLFFTTVYGVASFGLKNHSVLFRNTGDFSFSDVTEETGLKGLAPTYQAAWADYNNNGHLDLFTAGKLFENQGNGNSWIKVRLAGDGRRVNRSAIGTRVRLKAGGKTMVRQVEAGTGQGNQNELTLHFGLGNLPEHCRSLTLEVFWPDGQTQVIDGAEPNRLIKISYSPSG